MKSSILCSKCDGALLPVDVADNTVLADYGEDVIFECTPQKDTRTLRQNRALHKYLAMVAEALNNAGMEMQVSIKGSQKQAEIPWSMETVKECIWRPIQRAATGEESSSELDTSGPGEVYTIMSRYLSERLGINIHWPSLR